MFPLLLPLNRYTNGIQIPLIKHLSESIRKLFNNQKFDSSIDLINLIPNWMQNLLNLGLFFGI